MPHFSECCGKDTYICQMCAEIFCSVCVPSVWRPDITGRESAGNVCPECLKRYERAICEKQLDEQMKADAALVHEQLRDPAEEEGHIVTAVKIRTTTKVTKKDTLAFVQEKLATDKAWALKALLTIYAKQTQDEQRAEQTSEHNEVGFSGVDAELLSSFAKQYKARGYLSDKQMVYLFRKIRKYARQIIAASDPLKLETLILNYKKA